MLFIERCFAAFLIASLACCESPSKKTWFSQLDPEHSHINFSNDIHDEDSGFSFINEFGYMGGGVGIGDFNNDGLADIFFTATRLRAVSILTKENLLLKT